MTDNPGICWTFTYTCQHCHQTIQVTDGVEDKSQHPDCPEPPAVVIEGCGGTDSLAERVERALDDYDLLTAADPTA